MSTILNTLTREEVLRIMEIITVISTPEPRQSLRVRNVFKGVLPPREGLTAYGVWLGLSRIWTALDPNNIELHSKKDKLDFTKIFFW